MVELPNFNLEDLLGEVTERARENGVSSQEGWNELVEEILEEHINWGEMDIDDDITTIREALQEGWVKFEEALNAGQISEG